MSPWRLALLLLAGVAYAGLSHWMMLYHPTAPWAVVVLLGPLWLTAIAMAGSRFGGRGLALAVLGGLVGFGLVLAGEAGDPDRLYVFQHAAINALLCGWFGGTLRGPGLSLIGQFASRVHAVTPEIRRYTWKVTALWTAYFAAMVAASIGVYLTRSFSDWSVLANLVSPVCVGALFIGEHLLRYRLHPEFERTPLMDAVRAFYGKSPERP